MPKNTSAPPIPSTPPGMDLDRIEAALRLLAETAVAEEARAAAQPGGIPIDLADNTVARAIVLPVSSACRAMYSQLALHLIALVGRPAAAEICGRISHDMQDEAAALAAQPSTARH